MKHIKLMRDEISVLTIDRQEALNALNSQMLEELKEAVKEIETAADVQALIITGAGRAFAAGADIAAQSRLDVAGGREWGRKGAEIFRRIEELPVPTIAAVNGFALGGGCELALACDIILAGGKARFGQPEVGLGIIPGFSGTQRLPRRIGVGKAKELIYTGRIIDAEEAEKIGLANRVTDPENLLEDARNMAAEIVKNAPLAVRYAKAAIDRGIETHLETGIRMENELFALCFATEDQKEGMQAFLEKREAVFRAK